LIESYEEAAVALAGGGVISVYQGETRPPSNLSEEVETAGRLLAERRFGEAKLALAGIPRLIRTPVGTSDLPSIRRRLEAVVEGLAGPLADSGVDETSIAQIRSESSARFSRAGGVMELEEAFRKCADCLVDSVRVACASRYEQLVERACRLIRRRLEEDRPQPLSINAVAAELCVSGGHLNRVSKQITGQTWERHVMRQRIELAKRLLLDPTRKVSQVAERCGFSTQAYLTRVFRNAVGCSPREYANNPLPFSTQAPDSGKVISVHALAKRTKSA
jgi:AraC-like DNA-binding protein